MINLYPHQESELKATEGLNRVAYYHDMGLGKTFTGAEKMVKLGAEVNLVICQKSKIDDWVEHFKTNYPDLRVVNMTDKKQMKTESLFPKGKRTRAVVYIINYELSFRRPELLKLNNFTLMLDESSMIQNQSTKCSKFVSKLNPSNIILLSGTPTSGRYENLISQLHLLGWNISEDLFWKHYVEYHWEDNDAGFPHRVIDGYKNVERLKSKMREHGCRFLKTDEVFDLPKQTFNVERIAVTKDYLKFRKSRIIQIGDKELVGDTTLTKMLYERMLCGSYNEIKLEALEDLICSTNDRLIIFYNFNDELYKIEDICIKLDRPVSIINGTTKDLSCYEEYDNSVTLVQYQSGAMGLNLQKANKVIYFTPPLSSELFEQSKKRIHRIGQDRPCFYYQLVCKGSIEERIYRTLAMRKDYTEALFEYETST